MLVGAVQFGQADSSKTLAHTEAPMKQLGRAAAWSSIADHFTTQIEPADSRMFWNPKVSMSFQTIANTEGLSVALIFLCVLWGGVHKKAQRDQHVDLSKPASHTEALMTQPRRTAALNLCWSKHIQLYKLEKVRLKALWDSIQPDVPKKLKSLGLDAFPNHCKNEWFGGRFGNFAFCGVGYTKFQMYGNVGLNTFSFT